MKISVCMATYNGEKYIRQQLDSILSQLAPNDELIISDDGSADRTLEIIASYDDNRIRKFDSSFKNVKLNFANALAQVKGDVVFLSDQDDIWRSDKVEKSIKSLQNNLLVFSNAQVFEEGNLESEKLLYNCIKPTGFFKNFIKNNFIGATMAFKADLLKVALPFPKNIPMHDVWLGLLAEANGDTAYIDQPLIYYRRHDENTSTTGGKSGNSLLKKLKFRYYLLTSLIIRLYLN